MIVFGLVGLVVLVAVVIALVEHREAPKKTGHSLHIQHLSRQNGKKK